MLALTHVRKMETKPMHRSAPSIRKLLGSSVAAGVLLCATGAFAQDAPIVQPGASDSSALDNVFELLVRGHRNLPMVKTMMIPEASATNPNVPVTVTLEP